MLFFLFSQRELQELFTDLGYEYTAETARRTIDYYDRRTSHGSTLSHVTHARVLAELDPESSWRRFLLALETDIDDAQSGTTKEGIHLGVMAGTLDLLQRGYLGTEIVDDVIYFNPTALERLDGLRLPLQVRRTPIIVSINGRQITVNVLAEGYRRPITVSVQGVVREVNGGESSTFELAPPPHGKRGTRHRTPERFKGAIFDVDGVLVDSPHEAAWRETLRDLMETSWSNIRANTAWAPNRFTTQVYREVLAGKPRHSGALAALEYFAVPDPRKHVDEYARRKQEKVVALIEAGQFKPFGDAVRLMLDLRAAGIQLAAASSSKDATRMMAKLRLDMPADEYGFAEDFVRPRPDAARCPRRRRLWTNIRTRQAAPGDLPDRLPRARTRSEVVLRRRGRRPRHRRGQGRRHDRAWRRACREQPTSQRRRRRPGGSDARRTRSRFTS